MDMYTYRDCYMNFFQKFYMYMYMYRYAKCGMYTGMLSVYIIGKLKKKNMHMYMCIGVDVYA